VAGDWLKMESNTPEKPEVMAITVTMGWDDPDLTVGKLFRVWRWFDQQTTDGNAPRVTTALLDRIAGAPGFSEAMILAGWLTRMESGLSLPKFDAHNGASAKARAQGAKRASNFRSTDLSNADSNADSVTESVTNALPREEKRREDKEQDQKHSADAPKYSAKADLIASGVAAQTATDWLKLRAAKKAPATKTALDTVKREAERAGLSLDSALQICCTRGWQGFQASWVTDQHASAPPGSQRSAKFDPVAHVNQGGRPQARGGDDGIIDINPR